METLNKPEALRHNAEVPCPYCGTLVNEKVKVCPNCHAVICIACG